MSYFPETEWEIVIPVEAENLVLNPSLETNITGYNNKGAANTRSNEDSYWGAYSLKTPVLVENDGFYYTDSTLVLASGTAYNYSFYANVPDGTNMIAYIATTAGIPVEVFNFVGTGYWQRYSFPHTSPGSAQRRLYIVSGDNDGNDSFTWYTDGLMLVAGTQDQTYIDGDQPGCEWNGLPHGSTSTRDDSYRQGGYIYNLSHYGLGLKQQTGIGMASPTHIIQEYGNQDGGLYQGTYHRPRIFQLTTQIVASGTDSLANLHMQRDAIINAIKINLVGEQSPFKLRYTGGNTIREINVLYDAGMEFNATNVYTETLPLRFVATDPYFYSEGESAASLTPAVTISGAYIYQRNKDGQWNHLNTTFSSGVRAIAYDETRNLYYFGGSYTSPQNRISKYDPDTGTVSTLGIGDTGANDGTVYALWADPITGDVYAGGSFSLMSSVAKTKGIARWDYATQAWKPLASGVLNGQVNAITQGNDRDVFFGGTFTLMSGVANTVRIAKFTPSTGIVAALGAGTSKDVYDLIVSPTGSIFGGALNSILEWVPSSLTVQTITSGAVNAVNYGKDGTLYVGTQGTTINSVSGFNYSASWNGVKWSSLSTGFDDFAHVIKVDKKGLIYYGGEFYTAGSYVGLPSPIATWNKSTFFPIGIRMNTAGTLISDIHLRDNGIITIASALFTADLAEAVTTVTNDGSADVYPRIIINGPTSGTATLYFIKNYTTGDTIYFNAALTLNANEVMTLDLVNKTFTSNFQGNLNSKLLPGSNVSKFRLISGANKISMFTSNTTLTINMIWKDRFLSVDGGARLA